MVIQTGFLIVASKLQEAATDMSHDDIRSRVNDAIQKHPANKDSWASVVDVFGDDDSGDVVYSHRDGLKRAGYTMGKANGKTTCDVDCDGAEGVTPITSYEGVPDEGDMYASMEAAKLYTKGAIPLCERFISKGERDAMDSADFAGKGKSFPIKTGEDVMAAVRSMGRAGSDNYDTGTLKRRIIAIAKRKGLTGRLPKSWQDGGEADEKDSKESLVSRETVRLFESATSVDQLVNVREAKADYEIKLIAAGKGSSAYYPKEVLQRDGPNVFKSGTHVYVNHPTAAEESQRPEGDVKNLAGVLTGPAVWRESHPKGAGLYGRMKVFQDHAQLVEEKAAHVGMSIRANGRGTGKMIDGVPELASLESAESVDVVTRAGAGGLIVTESAGSRNQEGTLTAQDIQRIVTESNAPLVRRLLAQEARESAVSLLAGVSLTEASKAAIVERAVEAQPYTAGVLDQAKLGEIVAREAKVFGQIESQASGRGRVFGMGPTVISDPKLAEAQKKRDDDEYASSVSIFESLGMPKAAAELAAKGRAA
jgi:hypothetical protein